MSIRALVHPALLLMGPHVVSERVRRAIRGHRRHQGTAEEILRAGLDACWSGRYLTASPATYRHFWTRDTGFAARSLVRLGDPWSARLLSSLAWAMDVWRTRRSHVTTTIDPGPRRPVDIFDYGVDSLPLLLWSLRSLADAQNPRIAEGAATLAHEHRAWIAAEVEYFVERVVDPVSGLVRADRAFSAHRDTFRNGSTAYANTMVALLTRTVAETGWGPDLLSHHFVDRMAIGDGPVDGGALDFATPSAAAVPSRVGGGTHAFANPDAATQPRGVATQRHAAQDWGSLLRRHFWIRDRFRDRLGSDETSGEANVWPFFVGLVDDRAMLAAALGTLRREGYTAPFPLRFQTTHSHAGLLPAYRVWSSDYQTTTSWTSLGSIYLSLLREVDPPAADIELDRMRRLIERDGTFYEVIDARGRPWRSRTGLAVSDVSMLWGAILLETLTARSPATVVAVS